MTTGSRAARSLPEPQVPSDLAQLPWSRHMPTPWREVQGLNVLIACDGEDAPKPLTEGLIRDGHSAFWTSHTRFIARLREGDAPGHQVLPLDLIVVSARLLGGIEGIELLSLLYRKCALASLVLLGSETAQKAALARDLRESRAFQQIVTLASPADVDDLRMIVMHVRTRRKQSGCRRLDR
jgi:hypothetical protein